MTTAPTYSVQIGGSPVTVVAGGLNVVNQIGQRSTGDLHVWSPLGTTWAYGTAVQVHDDLGALVYAGYTTKDKITKGHGLRLGVGYLEHDLQLMDNVYKADKRRAVGSYLNASAGSIVRSLCDAILAAEGVTYTASSIAAGTTIVEAVWTYNKSVAEAIQFLATQSGYWWTIDVNNVLWFQPYGGIPAPFILDGTTVDAMQDLTVEFGNDMYVNSQFAKGSYQETPKDLTETLHGDSTTRAFTLSYQVSSIKHFVLNGAELVRQLGTKDQIGGGGNPYYYAVGDPIIAQDPGQTVLTSGDTLTITYRGRTPTLARAQNPALIAAQRAREGGGTGLVESSYSNTKVKTQAAAFQIASSLLAHYGQDTTILTFSTRTRGLQEGQMLTVNLPDYGLSNKQMLVNSVAISDQQDGFNIWFTVQCVGSPVESAQWQTYWQGLMNQSSDPSDLTDVADGAALALISSTTVNHTPHVSVSQNKQVGAVCGVSMLCGSWTAC